MATNYTTNYQLNQWEPTDQVLRTEFNADNAKIEAALTNKLGRSQLLQTITPEHNASSVRISLESMNWND